MFAGGAIRHTAVIPIAGDQVTNDIAMTLRTPTKEAEELKLRHGCALRQLADPNDIIEVPGVGDRPPRKLSRQTLAEVIEPRIEELYTLVQAELRRSGFEELLSSGIVLTGGTALLAGMTELGEEVFHLPVRVGVPAYIGRARGRRAQPPLCNRRRPSARGPGPIRRRAGVAREDHRFERRRRKDEAMVQGQFLASEQRERDHEVDNDTTTATPDRRKEPTMFEIIDQPMQEGAVIKVIGIGGCGGNAVEHMIAQGTLRRRVPVREHRCAGVETLDRARRSCSSARRSLAGSAPARARRSGATRRWRTAIASPR